MAMLELTLSVEGDPVHDAIEALGAAHVALTRRHGEAFRALERRIEAFFEADLPAAALAVEQIEPGLLTIVPAGPFRALLVDAQRLGVMA